jgi:LPXTG-motif cell wall-anchored protein
VNPGTNSTSPLAVMGIFVAVGAVVAGYYWKKKKGL